MVTSRQIAFKKQLIKKLHTIKTSMGISKDQYEAMLSGFGVNTSLDLSIDELTRLIDKIQQVDSNDDLWRKRCMAAIGSWLRSVNRTENSDFIKGVACKATGYKHFNAIPTSRLRDIYYEFSRKGKTAQNIESIVETELFKQILSN